jgi:hypothetical protein
MNAAHQGLARPWGRDGNTASAEGTSPGTASTTAPPRRRARPWLALVRQVAGGPVDRAVVFTALVVVGLGDSVLLPYKRTQRPALGNWRSIWPTRKLSRSACAERSCAGKKDCCSMGGSVAPSQPLPSPVETGPEVVKLVGPDSAP